MFEAKDYIMFYSESLQFQLKKNIYFRPDQIKWNISYLSILIQMINNNQYSYPEKSHQTKGLPYADISSNLYRKNSSDVNQSFRGSSARNTNSQGIPTNLYLKKSGCNLDQISPNFRPPAYPNLKTFIPSPKNNSSSCSNLSNINSRRASINGGHQNQSKETLNNNNQSYITQAPSTLDLSDFHEKIQTIAVQIKNNEKRITQLEKNSKKLKQPNYEPNNQNSKDVEAYGELLSKFQDEWKYQLKQIKHNITLIREQIELKFNEKENSQIKAQKIYETDNIISQKLLIKTENLRKQFQSKLEKNNQLMTTIVGRLEREIFNILNQITPSYKTSAIKCSSSAILLRYVQCFKVRKNSVVSHSKGESKIIMTDNTYYIDNQGFLLDKQQHYLIDYRGNQVRLEERHIRLLQQEKVLI